ncbi:unnamed protein product [Prorocentrum cordatum]|uniref:Uncharacterized protein n=1 Tax=Prorocentrum cordatum TaxID=2364126 RepID=A0ABN9Y6M7_9DINO|nr:unnamed protein product [Polarella glacialis]
MATGATHRCGRPALFAEPSPPRSARRRLAEPPDAGSKRRWWLRWWPAALAPALAAGRIVSVGCDPRFVYWLPGGASQAACAGGFEAAPDEAIAWAAAGPRLGHCAGDSVGGSCGVFDAGAEEQQAQPTAEWLAPGVWHGCGPTAESAAQAFVRGLAASWRLAELGEAQGDEELATGVVPGPLRGVAALAVPCRAELKAGVPRLSADRDGGVGIVEHGFDLEFQQGVLLQLHRWAVPLGRSLQPFVRRRLRVDAEPEDETEAQADFEKEEAAQLPAGGTLPPAAEGSEGGEVHVQASSSVPQREDPLPSLAAPSWIPRGLPVDPGEGRLFGCSDYASGSPPRTGVADAGALFSRFAVAWSDDSSTDPLDEFDLDGFGF